MIKSRLFKSVRTQGQLVFQSRLLKALKKTEAYEFIQLCHKRTYNAGEYIYHQNDPGNGLYLIEEGEVELIVEDYQSDSKDPVIRLQSPESFGNLSLSFEMRRMSSARAVTDVKALGFFNSDLETLQKRYPEMAIKIMAEINTTLSRQLQVTIQELAQAVGEANAYKLQFGTFYAIEEKE